jgi:pseudomonalisin
MLRHALERTKALYFAAILLATLALSISSSAQSLDRLPRTIDSSRTSILPNHHPSWANPANSTAAVPAGTSLDQLTLVLSRSPEQEAALEQLLADQQNPASPNYHHWLTPEQIGARFGISDSDMAAIQGWLQSQGLHLNWVSPSRVFVGFGGAAADVNHAFGTELRYYAVNGAQRISVSSDPKIPQALAPFIRAVRGLYSIDERPALNSATVQSSSPDFSLSNGTHFVSPKDFNTIYNLPASLTGAGVTVGIVSWSRTNFADFDNFRSRTGTSFPNPVEVVPTAFGGVDPGPAHTTQQSCNNCLDGQTEATLDVERVGSTAQAANILLMVSSQSSPGGGIGADAQYLVNTSPVPAQVINVSFGSCELATGSTGVAYWNTLFQQAAAEGISVFVSSGDSGAAGCDRSFSAPPTSPSPISPNYICSSPYATCMGGTQFNDANGSYWNSTNSPGLSSALGYIPEGGWNESTTTSVAASGGGVSQYIATPSWQVGTGVPSARAGRYTPDISFTAAGHNGYFGCMAASGGSCSSGPFNFVSFEGTSADAPSMAGIAAMLDQALGGPQGNLNPALYGLASSSPAAFHDVTVSSSGVANCTVNTASMCNNSIPSRTSLSGGQAGYRVGVGYDLVTGLGSMDVTAFLNSYAQALKVMPAVVVTPSSSTITTAQSLQVNVTVNGNPIPTGTVVLTSGSYSSSAVALINGTASIAIAAGALPAGTDTLSATYTPDASSAVIYNASSGSSSVTVTTPSQPSFTVSATAVTIVSGSASGNTSTVTVSPVNGFTGAVSLIAFITSAPLGTTNLPNLSFGSTTPVNLSGTNSANATLTISSTATQAGSCIASNSPPQGMKWYSGGAVFACLLLAGFGSKRRRFRALIVVFAFIAILAGGITACGGSPKVACTNAAAASGTPTGSYIITITGTSGSTSAQANIALTIQ